MAFIIGIDTGGTYTDAVIYDDVNKKVIAKGKAPTTRRDLAEGIGNALDSLPRELCAQAEKAALSTTLATNACIEGRGGRARLMLMGVSEKTLRWIEADKKYGFSFDDVCCVPVKSSFDGKVAKQPDWKAVFAEHGDFLAGAQALATAEVNAVHNGAVLENAARAQFTKRYAVPVVAGSDLAGGLNVMERGATALLNARLLPVIETFMEAVHRAFDARGIKAITYTVRSDGSLMNDDAVRQQPVQTILSGPAASVLGGMALADAQNCLIIDMGGTTTDISVVRDARPVMSGGISIGGWRTQINGVHIDTFGLGGDTRLYIKDSRLMLDTRRVEPLCEVAARWPSVRDDLERLIAERRVHSLPIYEFLYLIRRPDDITHYGEPERRLIDILERGPAMIGSGKFDMYTLNSDRLEAEGVVMRCGLTPTDVMHALGDFNAFDTAAAKLGIRYFVRALPGYGDDEIGEKAFCRDVYLKVKRRLYENIMRVLISVRYGDTIGDDIGDQLKKLIARNWEHRDAPEKDSLFDLRFDAPCALIGIGAPIHIFLPDVSRAMGVECILPESAEVANAVGAAVADIEASASAEIRAAYEAGGVSGYSVFASDVNRMYQDYDDAVQAAKEIAADLAKRAARLHGALGELNVSFEVQRNFGTVGDGGNVDLGTVVIAHARSLAGRTKRI